MNICKASNLRIPNLWKDGMVISQGQSSVLLKYDLQTAALAVFVRTQKGMGCLLLRFDYLCFSSGVNMVTIYQGS